MTSVTTVDGNATAVFDGGDAVPHTMCTALASGPVGMESRCYTAYGAAKIGGMACLNCMIRKLPDVTVRKTESEWVSWWKRQVLEK